MKCPTCEREMMPVCGRCQTVIEVLTTAERAVLDAAETFGRELLVSDRGGPDVPAYRVRQLLNEPARRLTCERRTGGSDD